MKKKKKKNGDLEDCLNKKLVTKSSDETTSHDKTIINNQALANTKISEEQHQQHIREAILKCLKS